MKQHDSSNHKKKTFLRIPTFPGGKEAYLQFIKDNVVYPAQAIANKIEGLVYMRYTVNNIGEVDDIEVTKGIGYGCDEEAIRVIRLLSYEPARNRGVKMKVEMKTRIHFQLPKNIPANNSGGVQISYTSTTTDKTKSPEPKPQAVYNYTIKLG